MTHRENLSYLYGKYRKCLSDNIRFNSEMKPFNEYCVEERKNINEYQEDEINSFSMVNVDDQLKFDNNVDIHYLKLNALGWTEKQLKNQ
jgi:hypothetical protein